MDVASTNRDLGAPGLGQDYKVFGCDAYELIPNNKLKNTLELPEGENCCLVTFVAE